MLNGNILQTRPALKPAQLQDLNHNQEASYQLAQSPHSCEFPGTEALRSHRVLTGELQARPVQSNGLDKLESTEQFWTTRLLLVPRGSGSLRPPHRGLRVECGQGARVKGQTPGREKVWLCHTESQWDLSPQG